MKKNLIILLMMPFIIAILGIVTVNTTFNFIDTDIVSIKWDYNDVEGFKYDANKKYLLYAVGVNQRNTEATANKELVWTVTNKNQDEAVHAKIITENDKSFLRTVSPGEVVVTCSNKKGNVYRSMNVVIYDKGAVLINTKIKASGNNIDPNIYYGEKVFKNNGKENATIDLQVTVLPSQMNNFLKVMDKSTNIDYDFKNQQIKINDVAKNEKAYLTLGFDEESDVITSTFDFTIVDEGINVYTYDDLMKCTSNSENGEIVVLRKSFESLENTFELDSNDKIIVSNGTPYYKSNNVECFGNVDFKTSKVTFDPSELYHFTTTYNKKYIEQWNNYVTMYGDTNYVSDQIYVALRVQKDFYGNGYAINLHNLTYPTGGTDVILDDGTVKHIPGLAPSDIFRGPLPFYSLGDHNNLPLIEALGQDNVGMYIDGNNILVNDINLRNCDFYGIVDTLNTVGTVVDVHGNNNKIVNSRLSNGKNVLRSFSSLNLSVDNCLLSYARCFLIFSGSDQYENVNENKQHAKLGSVNNTLKEYLAIDAPGDELLNDYMIGNYKNNATMKASLLTMQDALNSASYRHDEYVGTMTVNDTLFYYANVASIACETLFNGPFLYSGAPSMISNILGLLQTQSGRPLTDYLTTNVAGISNPVKIEVTGNSKFFNYQTIDKNSNTIDGLDISGLINENITAMASSLGDQYNVEVNIDKFFPIKEYLFNLASPNNELKWIDKQAYINVVAAYYGGGINNSVIDLKNVDCASHLGNMRKVDLMDSYLASSGAGSDNISQLNVAAIKSIMLKAVTVVIGFEPFQFQCMKDGYFFDEEPKVSELIENARRIQA